MDAAMEASAPANVTLREPGIAWRKRWNPGVAKRAMISPKAMIRLEGDGFCGLATDFMQLQYLQGMHAWRWTNFHSQKISFLK